MCYNKYVKVVIYIKKIIFLSLVLISIFFYIPKIDAMQIFVQTLTDKKNNS